MYCPFCTGARSLSVPGRAIPLRLPSVQRTRSRVGGHADREALARGHRIRLRPSAT